MEQKLKVGILGGTGMVGQRFISLLDAPIAEEAVSKLEAIDGVLKVRVIK